MKRGLEKITPSQKEDIDKAGKYLPRENILILWKNIETYEKMILGNIKLLKEIMKKPQVYKNKFLDSQIAKIDKTIKLLEGTLKGIKWYHRRKEYYRQRLRKLIRDFKIDRARFVSIRSRDKAEFERNLKRDPNYYKKRNVLLLKKQETILNWIKTKKQQLLKFSKNRKELDIKMLELILTVFEKNRDKKKKNNSIHAPKQVFQLQ